MKHKRKKSNGPKRHMLLLPVFLVAVVALIFTVQTASAGHHHHRPEVTELEDATIIVEVNATAGDAGFQIFLDGEGWKNISIYDPNWRQIFNVKTKGGVSKIGGGTELFLETAEPEYGDLNELQELLDLLPEGTYKFFGRTVEGDWVRGEAELTHVIPAGPEIVEPKEAAVLDPDDPVDIEWQEVTETILPGDVAPLIEGYQVIVEDEESGNEFNVTLPDDATQVTVPMQLLEDDTLYKFEVLAIEESGNQTIMESWFCTGPDGPGDMDDPCPEPE
jgi:hypothetical protein